MTQSLFLAVYDESKTAENLDRGFESATVDLAMENKINTEKTDKLIYIRPGRTILE